MTRRPHQKTEFQSRPAVLRRRDSKLSGALGFSPGSVPHHSRLVTDTGPSSCITDSAEKGVIVSQEEGSLGPSLPRS